MLRVVVNQPMDNAAAHGIARMIRLRHESPDLAVMTGIRTMMRMTMSVTITQHIFFRTWQGGPECPYAAHAVRSLCMIQS